MIEVEKVEPSGLFTNYIYKAIPLAFDESMSYYETLCGLLNYMKNTMIPALNNNADAVAELQNLMTELQTYVDNYFDNLDVQQEINSKLDSMVLSGVFSQIINDELFTNINSQILQNSYDINTNKNNIENSVKYNETDSITMNMLTQEVKTAITGGSTAVVGVDSISEENIQDGSISVFKLDDYLSSTKSISYGDPLDLGERYAGLVADNNGTLSIVSTDDNFAHLEYNLERGKIYSFTGINTYLGCGLIVANSDNDVLLKTEGATSSTVQLKSLIFKCNEDNLKAYMTIFKPLFDNSTYSQFFARYNSPILREVDIFTNNYKKITPKLINTLTDYYLSFGHDAYGLPRTYSYSGTKVYIYELVKGKKYNIVGYDWSAACGIYILGLSNEIIYQSTNEGVGNQYVRREYNFTATQDGYACLLERGAYSPTIEIIEDLIDNNESPDYTENLGFSKWFALGDSLTEFNFRALKNYVSYITEELNITTVNLGHSGSGYMHENSNIKFVNEISNITNYNYLSDVITVMGSINDFQHLNTLGQIGDTTTDTLYGCMYNFFDTLFTTYVGARVGIILPPPTDVYHSNYQAYVTYNKALKDTAQLFSIPVLDLSEKSNLKPWIPAFKAEFFTADGAGNNGQSDTVHPNSKGHWLMHNEIKSFLKSL